MWNGNPEPRFMIHATGARIDHMRIALAQLNFTIGAFERTLTG